MQSVSHREFRTWLSWREEQLNNPDRHDYYLMQIAGYVKHVMSSKSWNVKEMAINFQSGEPTADQKQIALDRSKRRWGVTPDEV